MSHSTKVISTRWIRETSWELLRRTGHLSGLPPPFILPPGNQRHDLHIRRVNPILFILSLLYEYSNLEYVHIHVIYRVNQAKYGFRIRVAASQEHVNTYSTCRVDTRSCTWAKRIYPSRWIRSCRAPLKVLCAPKWNDFEFPIIKTTKLLVETRSGTWAKRI